MNILVTGATGHVGLTLVKRLIAEGHAVRTLANDSGKSLDELKKTVAQHFHADITQYDQIAPAFDGVEVVYHLAARVSYRDRGWEELKAVNVGGVRNVIEACGKFGVRRLVHFSSIEAFSPYPVDQPLTETRPLVDEQFRFPYPRSKAMGQRLILEAIECGLNAVIVYPTAVIGPFDYAFRAANKILLGYARGDMRAVTEGGFNFVDVRDVVEVALNASEAETGTSYLASGHWHSFLEMAVLIAQDLGMPTPKSRLSVRQLELFAPVLSWWNDFRKQPPSLTAAAAHAVSHWGNVSHARATRDFGYQPRSFAQTVRETAAWLRENGYLEKQ